MRKTNKLIDDLSKHLTFESLPFHSISETTHRKSPVMILVGWEQKKSWSMGNFTHATSYTNTCIAPFLRDQGTWKYATLYPVHGITNDQFQFWQMTSSPGVPARLVKALISLYIWNSVLLWTIPADKAYTWGLGKPYACTTTVLIMTANLAIPQHEDYDIQAILDGNAYHF